MPLNVLIAPDKFKGTLSAPKAAEAMARGWRRARPHDELDLLPISDGGDGFGEVLGNLLRAKVQHTRTVDAAHRDCLANWWWEPKSKTAIVESARIIGLALLPPGKFHPFNLDTYGLGAVIRAAAVKGARHCVIGIGGSATNDGGFGLARSLGWKFYSQNGTEILRWTELYSAVHFQAPNRRRWFKQLTVAVDVRNPLLGICGATRVYGPQKGLRGSDFPIAEKNLRHLAKLTRMASGETFVRTPGAGAAGGLGFGLMTFFGAAVEPGFELFARRVELEERISTADMIITGEGCLDASTLMGKGVGQLARLAKRHKIPCIGLAGDVADRAQIEKVFREALALTDITSAENAKTNAAHWLELLAEQAARAFEQNCRE